LLSIGCRVSHLLIILSMLAFAGCGPLESVSSETAGKSFSAYCSDAVAYTSGITVTGTAKYEYRIEGNGVIPNGHNAFKPSATTGTFSLRLKVTHDAGTVPDVIETKSYVCGGTCDAETVVDALTNEINDISTGVENVKAVGDRVLGITVASGYSLEVDTLQGFTALNRKPIRYAEMRILDSSGKTAQCAQTDGSGNYSFKLPQTGKTYTVQVLSRANNSKNTAYVIDTPSNNSEYAISGTVTATGSPTLNLVAKGTGDLKGGAFNILDQILNAQDYLRATTEDCDNTFAQCQPFSIAPLVYVYWKKGVSPGIYAGVSGPISYYLTGQKELYILGGVNGDTDVEDMDHFDNSVIIHEYGHFIEDQYSRPDSPGGSHDGDSIIDPRLAWGEGWADFFQAAVTQDPYYRDTYGHVDCVGATCATNASFDEYLDPSGGSYADKPEAGSDGEGNFREFSVARLLWDVIKDSGVSEFAEIWAAFTGDKSMETSSDRFKTIGRFHAIQRALTGATNWSTIVGDEEQENTVRDYGNPLEFGSCGAITMAIKKNAGDNGSPDTSDQFRRNDFYIWDHPGGTLNLTLSWKDGGVADLDVYVYKKDYVYGTTTGRVASSDTESTKTFGTETISKSLSAGRYIVNIVGYTGVASYLNTSTYTTYYTLKIDGTKVCPTY